MAADHPSGIEQTGPRLSPGGADWVWTEVEAVRLPGESGWRWAFTTHPDDVPGGSDAAKMILPNGNAAMALSPPIYGTKEEAIGGGRRCVDAKSKKLGRAETNSN